MYPLWETSRQASRPTVDPGIRHLGYLPAVPRCYLRGIVMLDVLVGLLLGIITTLVVLYILGEIQRRKSIVLDDPTDDDDYMEIVKKLRCPECGSDNYRFAEVTELPWIPGEDRYCICNRCGRQFGDGK